MKVKIFGLAFVSLVSMTAHAVVRLPSVLSDHAVLQRERPIHLWGFATPGAHLTAYLHGQSAVAVADPIGRWSLYLKPEQAGGPYQMTISGDGAPLTISDLLVGDVWFASGQSNMEMPLNGFPPGAVVKDAAREIQEATHPQMRLLLVEHKAANLPQRDASGVWTACTPETASRFSAVAYFFGRELSTREHVPIGLIDSSWGGTPADPWVSLDTLGSDPTLQPAFASRARFEDDQTDVEAAVAAEQREDEAARAAGKPVPAHPWHPFEPSWMPSALYNGMIAPFTPLTIKGFLWYQGETNSAHDRAPVYGALFAGLIRDWRAHFAQGELPFLFVQISSFSSPGEEWGRVRDEQRRTLRVAHTAMAVSLDVGLANNVHPPDKQTVGARLALAARSQVYGEKVAYQGPMFRQATAEIDGGQGKALRVWFDQAHGLSSHAMALDSFEIAGADRTYVPAQARIDGETVVVRADAVKEPRYVRYGWASVVEHPLFNGDGLPAPTFSSEEFPGR